MVENYATRFVFIAMLAIGAIGGLTQSTAFLYNSYMEKHYELKRKDDGTWNYEKRIEVPTIEKQEETNSLEKKLEDK